MLNQHLAKALGSIASYAEAKDVPAVRLVCCDAAAYDLGYLPASDIAQRIALNPSHALRLTKRLLREGQHVRLDTLLELSSAYQALSHHTEDHLEAVNAFLDKRPAQFTGR